MFLYGHFCSPSLEWKKGGLGQFIIGYCKETLPEGEGLGKATCNFQHVTASE